MADEYKHIVRIANTDIDGDRQILYGLTKVKGVSVMFANALCRVADVDVQGKAGELSDKDIEKINKILKDPADNGIPSWMINRRKDYETGEDIHLLGGDIKFTKEQDVKRLKKIKAYRGVRHAQGLTSRGQKTKNNFRSNKGKGPGVKKRKIGKK